MRGPFPASHHTTSSFFSFLAVYLILIIHAMSQALGFRGNYPAFLTVDCDTLSIATVDDNSRRYSSSAAYAGPSGGWSGEKANWARRDV
jgi:hypothetical protein